MPTVMWIIIGIVSIWAIIKRKQTKNKNTKLYMVVLLFFSLGSMANAKEQGAEYSIQGKIMVSQLRGDIYIFLVDTDAFNHIYTGVDTVIIKADSKIVDFSFTNVKACIYGIRCFQDLNGNKILDKGLFGPTEPYGFSWNKGKTFPFKFKDISFKVEDDYNVTIIMEN